MIQNIFCKPKYLVYMQCPSIVEDKLPRIISKKLILYRGEHQNLEFAMAVKHRLEIHLEAPVAAGDFPWSQIILRIDMKFYLFEL